MEGKTLHQQKDYDLLYCDTCFIVVAWSYLQAMSVYKQSTLPVLAVSIINPLSQSY